MDRHAFRDPILVFLSEANPGIAIDQVDDDDDLVELGYIDSLRILELVMVFEQTYELTIMLESIDPRAFRTVGGICGVMTLHQDAQ
jgi:acyl carrier protein